MLQDHNTDADDTLSHDDQIARALWPHLHADPQSSADGLDLIGVSDEIGEGSP